MNVDGQMKWRTADNIERVLAEMVESDTYKLPCTEDGNLVVGVVNSGNKYVCDIVCDENGCSGKFRQAENNEEQLQLGCTEYNRGYIAKDVDGNGSFYKCTDHWMSIQGSLGLDNVGYYKNADGTTYNVVYAEHQIWMTKNLNVDVEGSYCYDGADSNCTKYGRLYTWNAAMEACPAGWRLPSMMEWVKLTDSGNKRRYLMDPVAWNGEGQSGFDALPGGYRSNEPFENGSYYAYKEVNAYFWSSDLDEAGSNAYSTMFDGNVSLEASATFNKESALSIRCVLD